MKKTIILASVILSAIFLVGCADKASDQPENIPMNIGTDSDVATAKLGGTCGGVIGKVCEPGLECQFNPDFADARGRCIESVVDKNLKCPQDKKPVCGLKNDQKNGYLNECEARRHGAEVLYEGFCKIDESIAGNCKARAKGIGTCFKVTRGFEFDGKKCIERNIGGCEAEIPFPSEEECQQECLN